jgi:hypothetical protein
LVTGAADFRIVGVDLDMMIQIRFCGSDLCGSVGAEMQDDKDLMGYC